MNSRPQNKGLSLKRIFTAADFFDGPRHAAIATEERISIGNDQAVWRGRR